MDTKEQYQLFVQDPNDTSHMKHDAVLAVTCSQLTNVGWRLLKLCLGRIYNSSAARIRILLSSVRLFSNGSLAARMLVAEIRA